MTIHDQKYHSDFGVIQSSLQLLNEEKTEKLISLTYAIFFEACPAAESLWEKDDPESRSKMFNGVILMVIDKLMRPEIFNVNLDTDIKDHHGYGVKKEMYAMFFHSLMAALREVLSDDFTEEMLQAWEKQLEQISGIVKIHIDSTPKV